MEDIAALAEVGKGTLYRYFQDKEELYTALLDKASCGLEAQLAADAEGLTRPRDRLAAMVRSVVTFFDANPHLFDLIQHAEVMQRPGQPFPWQRVRDQFVARVHALFEEAREAGEFDVVDVEMGTLMFLGGLRSVIRFGQRPRAADLAERVVAGFLRGYARGGCEGPG